MGNSATTNLKVNSTKLPKAKEILKWVPIYDLNTSLLRTINWYKDYLAKKE